MGRRRVLASGLAVVLSAALITPAMATDEGPPTAAEPGTHVTPGGATLVGAFTSLVEQARRAVLAATRQSVAASMPEPATIVRAGPRSGRAVALTFDDGTDRATCARIAASLRKHDAVGTFFVNGMHLKAAPKRWRRILDGMAVGNHTRSHRDLTEQPYAVVMRQIMHNEAIHEKVLGRPMAKLLRPPYGAVGPRIRRIAAQLGYEHVALWSVDTFDWKPSTSARRIVGRATGARPGSIILMHCSRPATAKAVPAIIRHYEARGIALVGLDELLGLESRLLDS